MKNAGQRGCLLAHHPRARRRAVDPHAAVGDEPRAADPGEAVEVQAPVIGPDLGDGEEVGRGARAVRAVQLDAHARDMVAQQRALARVPKLCHHLGERAPDRRTPLDGSLVADLEDAVFGEAGGELVESPAVARVVVAGDRVADLFACDQLFELQETSLRARGAYPVDCAARPSG